MDATKALDRYTVLTVLRAGATMKTVSPSPAEIETFLSRVEPFKSLSAIDREQLIRRVREKSFSRGETLYEEGEEADSVWILYKGRVQVSKNISDGKSLVIETLGPGEIFGVLCRLGGNGRRYPCTAIASLPTSALWMLDRTFMDYYMKNPAFLRGVCSLCSERLQEVQQLRCSAQEPVSARLASTLSRLYQIYGLTIPLTKREVSELIGAAQETTFRAMAALQKKGILVSLYGKIQLKKPDALKILVGKE